MFESYELRLVSLHKYLGATKIQQRAMLPTAPGLYIWTRDLSQALIPTVPPQELHDGVQRRMRPPVVVESGQLGKYRQLTVADNPPEFTTSTLDRLQRLHADGYPPELEWVLLCGGLFQRPLYVGKALNLRSRTRQHLSGRGNSRGVPRMLESGISFQDCMLILAVLKTPTREPLDDFGEADQPDESEITEDELAPWVTLGRQVVDDLIRIAESIVIRTAHPVFNDQMT